MTDKKSLIVSMANRYGMEASNFQATVMATCIPGGKCSQEQFAAFLLVANEYGLNPITKEIYAFPSRGGGIQPIVSIDGWMNIINSHPQFDGMEFEDRYLYEGKELVSITCKIYRKDRSHPTLVTEYMDECKRDTEPWKKWPARMLRHKAAIQCARYAFGFSGIMEPDEAERGAVIDITPPSVPSPPPAPPAPKVTYSQPQEARKGPGRPRRTDGTSYVEQGKQALEAALAGEEEAPEDPEEFDSELFVESMELMMAGCTDVDSLSEVWNEYVSVELEADRLFPPDKDGLEASYQKHLERIEQKGQK